MNNNTYNPQLADPAPAFYYDPFILNPSKALLKQCLTGLKQQCYEIIKKQSSPEYEIVRDFLNEQHQRLLRLIKLYEFRIRSSGKKGRQGGNGISQSDIERARQYPVRDLYTDRVRQVGQRLLGKCPFHQDDKPSFVIYEDNRGFNCFGCGANGNAITYVMKSNKMKFIEAVKYLISK